MKSLSVNKEERCSPPSPDWTIKTVPCVSSQHHDKIEPCAPVKLHCSLSHSASLWHCYQKRVLFLEQYLIKRPFWTRFYLTHSCLHFHWSKQVVYFWALLLFSVWIRIIRHDKKKVLNCEMSPLDSVNMLAGQFWRMRQGKTLPAPQ